MKRHRSRKPAEAIGKWKFCIGTLLPSVLAYCLVFCPTEIGWAGLACLSNPCLYGICIDDVNSTFLCYCMDGYTGFLCQTNWDECWSNPCLNGGVCIDGIAQYNCSCPQGYQGDLCEQNIDECDSNPCHNNGTCIDGPNGYTCLCLAGYVGDFCETDVSVCNDTQETRCLNGGLCIEGPGCTFNCACPLGWEGQYCEEAMDECASSPCLNGAVCLDLHANYTCACPFGFTGRNCEVELEMCGDKSPCQNGAVCLVEDWLRVCYCVPDFHGDRCQFQYNECLLGPGCKNGGTCIDGVDGYTCSCPANWTGQFCECLILSEEEIDCNYLLRPPVPTWNETAVPKTTLHGEHSSTISPTKQTTPKHSHTTECVPFWSQFTVKTPKTTTQAVIPAKNVTFPENWFTQVTLPTQKTEQTKWTTAVTTEITKPIKPTTPETTFVTTTTTQTTPTIMTPTTSTTTQTTPTTTTTTTTTQTTPTTTTTTQTTPTTTSTTETTQTTTTTTQTIPTTTTTTETTSTTITTQTTPTTTTTEETTPTTTTTTTTTTTQTTPTTTTTTTTTQTTPTTTTTTQTTPTTTQTTPTTTSTTETTTITTQTTPTTTTTTTQTTPLTTTTIQTTTTTTETTPPPTKTTTTTTTMTTSTESPAVVTSSSPIEPTTGSPAPWDCKITPCKNGGMCLNTTTGPRCLCRVNWEGPLCDNKTDIKVVGLSGKSYLSHRLTNTHSIRIDVTARTIARVGVILYSHLGPNIFMTLYLENGLLKFKFSCGVQTMLLSEVQFHINNGFDLVATVTLDFLPRTNSPLHCAAAVRINNTLAMSGEQLAKGPHADSGYAWVYIGGVPSRYVDIEEVPVLEGFTGCMQNLVINKEERGIFKDSFDGDEITECKSLACLSNPCRGGASCVESNSTWSCLCPSGFLGRTCETSVCNTNPCLYGGTCAPFPGSGFICLCPLGKQGLFCENDVETGYPLFSSSVGGLSSFAAYKLPVEIYQDMLLTFKFLPHDMEQISLMIFIGQDGYHSATSDHLAVSFIKGYVVLTWNLGSGPRRIFTTHPVPNTGRFFHTVQIGRKGQRAWLAVDNQRNVTGRSPGKLTQLNTRSLVYLGGHDSRNFSLLPHDLPLHTGFSGCLFDVELRTGQMLIKIEKTSPAFSRGVGQCGRTLCNKNSCKNGGGCIHHGATFTCLCSDGWFGPTCSMKFNPCDSSRHNCSTGSTCVPLRHGFACDCPVGKTGKYCETSEELSDVKLKGTRSYIALAVDGLHPHQTCLDLELRPQTYHGLVLYSGKAEGNSFWSLSLQDGVLELRISPGVHRRRGDILVIKSRRPLILGKWHRIRIGRYGRRLFLWVEGTASTGVLLPGENLPPSGTVLFIGGVPDLSKLPIGVSGKFLTPFQGCVRKLASRWKAVPLTKSNIIEGRNVEDCDGTPCGGDVCENGGTCQLDSNKRPFCTCLKEYLGKRCEYRLSCKEVSCHNGGRCADEKSLIPRCHCPNGWGGPFCETAVTVKSPQFGGNSYLLIDRTESTTMKRRHTSNKVDVDFVYLNFTTAENNGMLLWSSRERDAEFLGIGVENGKMKFVWAWEGNDPFIITPDEDIADGAWHDVAISFDSPNITIWMDSQMIYKSNMSYPGYPLVTDGKFFLGGFPEHTKIANETLGHFLTGFDGCLQKLSWGTESEIFNFANFTGENIRTCDSLGLRKRK